MSVSVFTGVAGGRRAPAVLSAERRQRRPAGGSPDRQQPLQRAALLCCSVKVRVHDVYSL